MYLEISNRQSGKTQRMIKQIFYDKDFYQHQILMGMNFQSLQLIKKQIRKNNKVHICLTQKAFRGYCKENNITNDSKVRLYVDEFLFSNAFCNNFNQFMEHYKPLLLDGYFSSSINTSNEYVLWTLSQICDGGIVQVIKYPKGFNRFQ